jgi:secondary thiamine-phosphate synthase enzyme
MSIFTGQISLQSKGNGDILDITAQVAKQVSAAGINAGTVTVFITGSTAGITTIEYEPGLVSDLNEAWERLVPRDIPYGHDQRWGDGNGYAHVRASLLGAFIVIPLNDGKLTLGTWQQIVVADFDNRPRSRQVVVQVMGE